MKLVLATFNRDKARELKSLLAHPWLELVPLYELSGASAPAETGTTLLENALLKARAALKQTGMPVIADDTGLEVDSLNGAPGIFAARYAGLTATATENIALLLERMSKVSPELRTARFRTVAVAVFPQDEWTGGPKDIVVEGVLEGRILDAPRGRAGFGYDPIFEVAGAGRSLAEHTAEEKNEISHRSRAIRELATRLSSV